MKSLASILGPLALAGTIVPPLLFLLQLMGEVPMKWIMLASAILWFVSAPFWLRGGTEPAPAPQDPPSNPT
jgi:hypothetical protein